MKTLFTFRAKDNPLSIQIVDSLITREDILKKHPKATHVVMTRSKMILAICGSEIDARAAKTMLDNFKTIQ